MNKMKIGCIGAGNMATAIIGGMIAKRFLMPEDIAVYDISEAQTAKAVAKYGVRAAASQKELIEQCEFLILAVKPVYMKDVLVQASPVAGGKKFISIAAGWTVQMLKAALNNPNAAILRCMPNTPLMVGEGFTALCEDTSFSKEDLAWARALFESLGSAVVLPERLFDAIVAVSGSSPAYVFVFVEALIDAGIKLGLPRDVATKACEQTVLGAAKMLLETGEHPARLKDMVCSPGGTTIEAIASLENNGFRNAIIQAASACAAKSKALARPSDD
jgi:pyrroline-5-carboxylate reductase